METDKNNATPDVHLIVQQAIEEYTRQDASRREPAYKAELAEERKRREQLEKRLNQLVEENKHSRKLAEEAERGSAIRSELQRLGVSKIDLAYKAVQEDIFRTEDGRLVARGEQGETSAKEYLSGFVSDNPEFLPARISGGSGTTSSHKAAQANTTTDLDKISPSMTKEELDRVRQEIVRVASQTLRST